MKFIPEYIDFLNEETTPWYYFSKEELVDITKDIKKYWSETKSTHLKESLMWFRFTYNRDEYEAEPNLKLKYLEFKVHNLFLKPTSFISLYNIDKVKGKFFDSFLLQFADYFPLKEELIEILKGYGKYYDNYGINNDLIIRYLKEDRKKNPKRLKDWEKYWNARIKKDPRLFKLIESSEVMSDKITQ